MSASTKVILVDGKTHQTLLDMGKKGETFNDVITRVLKSNDEYSVPSDDVESSETQESD